MPIRECFLLLNLQEDLKMLNKNKLSPLALALGTSFAISLTASPIVNAADNPFTATQLSNGYMVAEHGGEGEGKCGEGKCGDKKKEGKKAEGKCGEGKCGDKGDEMKDEHGKTTEEKSGEGKCGEGKCGDKK